MQHPATDRKLDISRLIIISLIALALTWPGASVRGSYGIYVGRNLTTDGSVFLGGSGDEVSGHWLELVPARQHSSGDTVTIGVDENAFLPGELSALPQVPRTARYLTMNYTEYEGFPPPLTNGGLNEFGVAARDIWAPSRPELVEMTPSPQRGPNYSDLSRLVMERARTAEEAARLVGELIDTHGYSSYGGNSHMFADANEGWVLLEFAGGQGLWVARRLGPDEVVMFYPGYMGEVPIDISASPDFMASENFVSFAVEQGWFDPTANESFDVTTVYGTSEVRYPRREMEQDLKRAAPLDLRAMLDAVRDPRISKDATGYGQVAQLRETEHAELQTLWVAPTGSVTAPFIPWRMGVNSVLPEFGRHRYLGKNESRGFLTRDWQAREATRFAGRLFKQLMYFTCEHPDKFLPEVTEALTAFEDRLIAEQAQVDVTATTLMDAGEPALATGYLTDYTHSRARDALVLGEGLLAGIEARTRVLFGIREPDGNEVSRLDYQMVTCQVPSA